MPSSFDEARANIIPILRNTSFLDITDLLGMTSSSSDPRPLAPRFVPVVGDLLCGLAYDTPQTLAIFSGDMFEKWGVSFEDAMKAARYNLSVRSREPMKEIAPGLFLGPWQDANAAGRMILSELLLRLPVKGDVVAMVPGRECLLVTGSENADALGAMVGFAERVVQQPRSNTPEMYRLRGTLWELFELPAGHAFAERHRLLLESMKAADYEQQKKLLDQVNQKADADIFVGTYSVVKRPTGEIASWCSWADQCVSLLPKTDLIAIMGSEGTPVMVPWAVVIEVVGHRMKRQEQYRLPRWLVEESPSVDEITVLRQRGEPMGAGKPT